MARPTTGAITVYQTQRLNIKPFVPYLKMDAGCISLTTKWENGNSITVEIEKYDVGFWFKIIYTLTDRDGIKHPINYKVHIYVAQSNLGKGEIYFFICPFSGRKCKSLHLAYGSHYYKSKEAYSNRLYYPVQQSGKLDRHNDTYWILDARIKRLKEKHRQETYNGKETKAQSRIKRLQEKQDYCDRLRWIMMPQAAKKNLWQFGI